MRRSLNFWAPIRSYVVIIVVSVAEKEIAAVHSLLLN
jgi:hypothetical protein